MREHVLDVIGQAPDGPLADDVDRGGGDDLVVVVDQLQQGFLDVPRPRALEDVPAADPLFHRHVFENRHDALAELSGEDVVEVFGRARAAAPVAALERPPGGSDVAPRIDERQQPVDPVLAALQLFGQRLREQRVAGQARGARTDSPTGTAS